MAWTMLGLLLLTSISGATSAKTVIIKINQRLYLRQRAQSPQEAGEEAAEDAEEAPASAAEDKSTEGNATTGWDGWTEGATCIDDRRGSRGNGYAAEFNGKGCNDCCTQEQGKHRCESSPCCCQCTTGGCSFMTGAEAELDLNYNGAFFARIWNKPPEQDADRHFRGHQDLEMMREMMREQEDHEMMREMMREQEKREEAAEESAEESAEDKSTEGNATIGWKGWTESATCNDRGDRGNGDVPDFSGDGCNTCCRHLQDQHHCESSPCCCQCSTGGCSFMTGAKAELDLKSNAAFFATIWTESPKLSVQDADRHFRGRQDLEMMREMMREQEMQ